MYHRCHDLQTIQPLDNSTHDITTCHPLPAQTLQPMIESFLTPSQPIYRRRFNLLRIL